MTRRHRSYQLRSLTATIYLVGAATALVLTAIAFELRSEWGTLAGFASTYWFAIRWLVLTPLFDDLDERVHATVAMVRGDKS